ncbi:MAG: bifunctional phosphoribosylaminoimidazolecarboxamide formyltransferase/IMP cyclohydrolase, partial [bacterium]
TKLGVEILSTGGSGKALKDAGVPYTEISACTGFPEIFAGRVKTLHPQVFGGILQRRDRPDDRMEAEKHQIKPIDLVIVNLYPFEETVAREGVTPVQAIESIDIGGPSLIRAAAKNHKHVGVLTSPAQYPEIMAELAASKGALSHQTRHRLAAYAFEHTARYDRAIADWFLDHAEHKDAQKDELDKRFPTSLSGHLIRHQVLRYGENPHQKAAFYRLANEQGAGLAACRQIHGKELSFNNLIDADIALALPYEFNEPAVAILKHTTPSGVAVGKTLAEAEAAARACDPVSAFGGIVGMNRECDDATAEQISQAFTEVIVAPNYDEDALKILKKKKNLRLLIAPATAAQSVGFDVRRVAGGLLLQDRDTGFPELQDLKVVTKRQPTPEEWDAMAFGWIVSKYVKSNAVLFARNGATLGVGAGQMSRVDAVHVAAWKAEQQKIDLAGSVLASDAFFPFPDGLIAAVEAGATAVIQPGGSVRDEEVIAAADERGIAMVFTGRRHFRHA